MINEHDAAYRKLAAKYGLWYRVLMWHPVVAWRGNGLFQIYRGNTDHMAHELAHYLVATPLQRRMPEFGLGTTARFACGETPPAVSGLDRCDSIEALASLLGIFIMKYIEGHKAANEQFEQHMWCWGGARIYVQQLIARKLLIRHNGRLKPRCLVRAPRPHEIYQRKAVR